MINQPPPGTTVPVTVLAGQLLILGFDPSLAQARVDEDGNLVLTFSAGTADEARLVFLGLAGLAEGDNPPVLQIAGVNIGSDALLGQVVALAATQPNLQTAAGEADAGEPGHGTNVYNDDLGTAINLLAAQGVIPPVFLQFPEPELTDPVLFAPDEPQPEPPIAFDSSVTSVEGQLIGVPGSEETIGGFVYKFDVGEDNDISDNIHGTDLEDGVTTAFTITTLPLHGLLVIDRGDDGTLDEVYGATDTFISSAQTLPSALPAIVVAAR